ncbi:hypothetical protein HKX48_003408 [Thoreauomyces humboldtii]|nr:hypothetical protein HKX48_003408 [Thoreauomyces humboldtii]
MATSHSRPNNNLPVVPPLSPLIQGPPPPNTIFIDLLCWPNDLAPDALPPPQTYVSLPRTFHATTCADVCSYVTRCPVFQPYLAALKRTNKRLKLSLCRAPDSDKKFAAWVKKGMPGTRRQDSQDTLTDLGISEERGNRLWCLVELEAVAPKAGVVKTANGMITEIKTAFLKTDFRLGSLIRIGNAGKVGVE